MIHYGYTKKPKTFSEQDYKVLMPLCNTLHAPAQQEKCEMLTWSFTMQIMHVLATAHLQQPEHTKT